MSEFALSLYQTIRSDLYSQAKRAAGETISLWFIPTKYVASSKFLARGTNLETISAQAKVMLSQGFTVNKDTKEFTLPQPFDQKIKIKLTMNQDDADVQFRKTFISKTTRLFDPKLEAKLIFTLPKVIDYYVDESIEVAYSHCTTADQKIAFCHQLFEMLLDELEITTGMKIQTGNNALDIEKLTKESEGQIRSLMAVILTDQFSSLLFHPNMDYSSSVSRVLDNLLATIQDDNNGLILDGRPNDWSQFYDMKPEAPAEAPEPVLTDNVSIRPNLITNLTDEMKAQQEKEFEELSEEALKTLQDSVRLTPGSADGCNEFTYERMQETAREPGFALLQPTELRARYRQAAASQYGNRQDDTKKFKTLGTRTYGLVASSLTKDSTKVVNTREGFSNLVINKTEQWEAQVCPVIQYLSRTLCLFGVFTDIKMWGLGIHGGPVSLMRISRVEVQKASADALLLLALCMPDLFYTTQSGPRTQSVCDWVTESKKHELAASLNLSASSGTLIREAITMLKPLAKNETSFADTIRRIMRERGTPTEGQNIIKTVCPRPNEKPRLNKVESFKLYIEASDIEALSQIYNDYEGRHNSKGFKEAILGKPLRITYFVPKLVKSQKEYKQFGRVAYELDYQDIADQTIDKVGEDELEIITRYGCIISCLADEITATGTIAQGIETVIQNQQTILSTLDKAEEYIVRTVNPLEFLCKAIGLRRLNTIVKSRKAQNEKFLTGEAKNKAITKFMKTEIESD